MKSFIFSLKIMAVVLMGAVTFLFAACESEAPEPVIPENPLGHGLWGKVEVTLYTGHLHGTMFHRNSRKNRSLMPGGQRVVFTRDESSAEGGIRMQFQRFSRIGETPNFEWKNVDEKAFLVLASSEGGGARYAMEIDYYDTKGTLINEEYVTPEMIKIHQHFFPVSTYDGETGKEKTVVNWKESNKDLGKLETSALYQYTYRDTNPINLQIGTFVPGTTTLVKLNDCWLGFKGYFRFLKPYLKFDMNVCLVHFNKPKGEKDLPYDRKDLSSLGVSDFNQSIPFIVVSDSSGDLYQDYAFFFKRTLEEVKAYEKSGPDDDNYHM